MNGGTCSTYGEESYIQSFGGKEGQERLAISWLREKDNIKMDMQ
jgi:hypothetical protein